MANLYFGFGSNLSPSSLEMKGVSPHRRFRGIVRGWTLAFDLTVDPPIFGLPSSVGNIHRADASSLVHGVGMELDEESWENMKQFEDGYAISYVNVEVYPEDIRLLDGIDDDVIVSTTDGKNLTVKCTTFHLSHQSNGRAINFGLKVAHDPEVKPGENYLNMITSGAETCGLRKSWIEHLKSIPFIPMRRFDWNAHRDAICARVISRQDILAFNRAHGTDDPEKTPVQDSTDISTYLDDLCHKENRHTHERGGDPCVLVSLAGVVLLPAFPNAISGVMKALKADDWDMTTFEAKRWSLHAPAAHVPPVSQMPSGQLEFLFSEMSNFVGGGWSIVGRLEGSDDFLMPLLQSCAAVEILA